MAAAVPLRWLGALHHLALLGREPWAALWPPASPLSSDAAIVDALALAWRSEQPHLQRALSRAPQTNEVMRSAALLPGLLQAAVQLQRPLQLLEIGASAGLNLWCDHYGHEAADGSWRWTLDAVGPGTWPVLRADWQGRPPPMAAPLHITHRAGCDAAPVDLALPGEATRLASFVWADQRERLARLYAAITQVAPRLAGSGAVQAQQAAGFLGAQLAQRRAGEALVVMHSVVWQYIGAAEQADIQAQMQAAAAQATALSPLAWLRLEPPSPRLGAELRLRCWPGGEDRLLAYCHPHGTRIEWLAASAL